MLTPKLAAIGAVGLVLMLLSGCAAIPAAGWAAIGAGFGYAASVNNLGSEALKVWDDQHPVIPGPAPQKAP